MAETLKMGIEAAYPPFNNKDASGNVVGFDKDIGDALCAKMKVECTVVTSDWDGIIPALNAKKFDFLVSSCRSPTSARARWTSPTRTTRTSCSSSRRKTSTSKPTRLLKGKIIGTQRATLAGTWLEDNLRQR
jgi:polar amino acid transport system substrate-binding protein